MSESGPLAECVVLRLDAGWSDVGAWSALWEDGDLDADGNLVRGNVYAQSTSNSLLLVQRRLLAAVGMDNVIVVENARGGACMGGQHRGARSRGIGSGHYELRSLEAHPPNLCGIGRPPLARCGAAIQGRQPSPDVKSGAGCFCFRSPPMRAGREW